VVIVVGLDIRTDVRFLVVVLDTGSDWVSWDVVLVRIGHGRWVWRVEKKRMEVKVDVDLLL
jgi:hypothetical protein